MPEFFINTLTHPAFTAAIGFLAGHFLAIGRDRRKEFNEAAEILTIKLIAERNNASPFVHCPTDIEFEIFSLHLPFWKRGRFNRCIKKYKKTKIDNQCQNGESGEIYYHDKGPIVSVVTELLKFTERK